MHYDHFNFTGKLTARLSAPTVTPAAMPGLRVVEHSDGLVVAERENAFVNLGLHAALDNFFGINTPSTVSHMGISDDSATVSASTTQLDASPSGDSPQIRALGSGTGATATSRTGNTVTCSAGWDESDFGTATFDVRKIGLLNAATDAADDSTPTVQGILDIIGSGSPILIALTQFSEFDLTLFLEITASAV